MESLVSWDLETHRFGPCNLAPKPICVAADFGEDERVLVASCEPEFDEVIEACLQAPLQTNTNIAFDMSVILAHRPHLSHLVFAAYREDRVTDIMIRDMLLVLADTGDLKFQTLENGAKIELRFSQLAMEQRHLGIDRSADKDDEDAPRSNYDAVEGIPAADYPEDFRAYPLADAANARRIFFVQEQIAKTRGGLGPQFLNARAALALQLSSCWGMRVDKKMAQEMFDRLSAAYHERNYPGLVKAGILNPSQPAEPYVKQVAKAEAILGCRPVDWEPHRAKLEELGIKFKQPKPSSYSTAPLKSLVESICARFGIDPKTTESGQISVDKEVQADLKGFDETFDEYIHRKETEKLVSTELPRMLHGRVHPKYRILVKSGRTSCFGNSKKDTNPAYPAVNLQNVDERVREAYIPSEGRVLCSIDYDFIELVSVAQKCLDLFGSSVLADKINAGYDPHAFLGANIIKMFNPDFKGSEDPDENYHIFLELKKTDRDTYAHFRKLAKPTGLGFPGGLGPNTFIGFAKSTYGVDIVKLAGSVEAAVEMAQMLRRSWHQTYPEMQLYFNHINKDCIDDQWSYPEDYRYCYQSPMGMIRRNCHYCEATNGKAMQTPTAEGAKIALFLLAEAMYDATLGDCLLGTAMCPFVHDEVILDMPFDEYTHERAYRAAHLMIEGMRKVMTKVKVGAKPTLMLRWNKQAEPRFDNNNRLIPWTP